MRPELIHLITRLLEKDHSDAVTGVYSGNALSEKSTIRAEKTTEPSWKVSS